VCLRGVLDVCDGRTLVFTAPHLQVMTSMRVVQRANLAPAIAREATALQTTRVVIGSTGWFMQQRLEGSAASWATLLAFVGSRVPAECLIMMVEDGRLAAVKRGSLSEEGMTERYALALVSGSLVAHSLIAMTVQGAAHLRFTLCVYPAHPSAGFWEVNRPSAVVFQSRRHRSAHTFPECQTHQNLGTRSPSPPPRPLRAVLPGTTEEVEAKKVPLIIQGRDVSPMSITHHSRDPGDFPRGPERPAPGAVDRGDRAQQRHGRGPAPGGTMSDTRSRRSGERGQGEGLPAAREALLLAPARRPRVDGRGPSGDHGVIPPGACLPPALGLGPSRLRHRHRGAEGERGFQRQGPAAAGVCEPLPGAPARRRASPRHAMLERLGRRRAGSPGDPHQQPGAGMRSPIPRWHTESPPSSMGGRRSLDSGLHGALPASAGSPGEVPARFGSPRRGLRLDPFSLRLCEPSLPPACGGRHASARPQPPVLQPRQGPALSPFSLRLSPYAGPTPRRDRATNRSAERAANGSAGSRCSCSPGKRSPLHMGAFLRQRSPSPLADTANRHQGGA